MSVIHCGFQVPQCQGFNTSVTLTGIKSPLLRDIATCPYTLSCPLSLTSDPVLGWSMSEKSLVTCSGSWSFGPDIEFKMAPSFAQNPKLLLSFWVGFFGETLIKLFNAQT